MGRSEGGRRSEARILVWRDGFMEEMVFEFKKEGLFFNKEREGQLKIYSWCLFLFLFFVA